MEEERDGHTEEPMEVRPLASEDTPWVIDFLTEMWGSTAIISRGKVHQGHDLPGFVAEQGGKPLGLITYAIEDGECEFVTLNSLVEGVGIGTELLKSALKAAVAAKCKRAWAITTNDNLNALRFYQTRGFSLTALYRNAVEESRKIKPEIPDRGQDNIPIRDEIEVELQLM